MKKGLLVLWIILMAFPAIAGWSRDSDGNYGWMDGKENSALVTLLPFLRTWGLVDAANGTDPAPGSYYATIVFDDGYGVRVSGDSVTDKIWWDIDGCMLNLEKIDVTVDTLLFCADSDGVTKRGSISDIYAGYVETDPVFGAWLLVPPNISTFTNDSGYITSTDGSGWVDRGTYIEQVTGSDEIAMRQDGSGGNPANGHVEILWRKTDTKPTLYSGSTNAANAMTGVHGASGTGYGVYAEGEFGVTKNSFIAETRYNGGSPLGILYKGASPWLHDFSYGLNGGGVTPNGQNIFIGDAGNFTMGSAAANPVLSSNNIGVGKGVLAALTDGYADIGIGTGALGTATTGFYNVGAGYYALSRLTTGDRNYGFGNFALSGITTGDDNVGVGHTAGAYIADGSTYNETTTNGIYIGRQSMASADGVTNEIVIGSYTAGIGSNSATLGNTSVTKTMLNGKIGISEGNPTYDVSFKNDAAKTIRIENTANTVPGRDLTVSAGSTVTAGTSNHAGGTLTLESGLGKGTGASTINLRTGKTLTSGNTLQSLTDKLTIYGSNGVWNEGSEDFDFRMESDDNVNMLFMDAEQNGFAFRTNSVPNTVGSREDVIHYLYYGASGQAPNDYSQTVWETNQYAYAQFLKPNSNNTETAVLFGRPSVVYWGWVHHWRDGSAREMVAIAADSGNRKYYMDVNGHYIHGLDNAAGSYYMRYNTGTEEISYTTSARWHKDVLEEHWKLTPEKMKKYLQIPVSRAIYKSDKQEIICCIADNVAAQLPELAIHEVIKCDVSDDGNPMHRRTVNKVTERWGGVKYEEFPLYNLEILKQHEARITDLESQVAELRTLIEGLVKDNEALRKRIDGHE